MLTRFHASLAKSIESATWAGPTAIRTGRNASSRHLLKVSRAFRRGRQSSLTAELLDAVFSIETINGTEV